MDLKRVDVNEAKRLVDEEGYTIVDVRSVPEYDESHPEGAYNVPFLHKTPQGMIPNADFVATVEQHFDKGAKLLMTCGMGGRSVRATQELLSRGFEQVLDIAGGFGGEYDEQGNEVHPGWVPTGLPVEHGAPEGRAYRFIEPKKEEPGVSASEPTRAKTLDQDLPEDAEGMNRFASRRRTVQCIRLGRELPGLKRRPYPGPLGQRLFDQVSAEAWNEWVEHSKMIINEYRINSADPNAIKLLMEQCEQFFFGEGAQAPEGYVPQG